MNMKTAGKTATRPLASIVAVGGITYFDIAKKILPSIGLDGPI